MKNSLIAICILLSCLSCKKEKHQTFADELRQSPEQITFETKTLDLIASLRRDFMPISEPGGSPLYANSTIIEVDSQDIPESIHLIKHFIIHGDEIWETEFTKINTLYSWAIRGSSQNGPKWGPDIEVDVVCEFELNGKTHRILEKSTQIKATF